MIDLKDFQERRNLLEGWYDRVLDVGDLLEVDDAALREAKDNLHADRFIVAICGQMNSGKSTLLNALLFSNEVLPSAMTTTTAKITLMEGNVEESVEATLYTPDEFRRVVEASRKDVQAAAELSEARDCARAAGLREAQLLTDPAQMERRAGLDDLSRFTAVSTKGGTYNPIRQVGTRAGRPSMASPSHGCRYAGHQRSEPGAGPYHPRVDPTRRCSRLRHVCRTGRHGPRGREVRRRALDAREPIIPYHRRQQV